MEVAMIMFTDTLCPAGTIKKYWQVCENQFPFVRKNILSGMREPAKNVHCQHYKAHKNPYIHRPRLVVYLEGRMFKNMMTSIIKHPFIRHTEISCCTGSFRFFVMFVTLEFMISPNRLSSRMNSC